MLFTDNDISGYIFPDDLPVQLKINGQLQTLELITILEIIKTVEQYSHDCEQNYTNLPLPPNICKLIQDESKYQCNLYLSMVADELALNYK